MQPGTSAQRARAITIRPMREDDIPAVSELAGRIWRRHYVPEIVTAAQIEYMLPRVASPEAIEKSMRENRQRFWLLHDGTILAGYIAAEPRETGVWFIDKLYVDATAQRGGMGSTLLKHAVRELVPSQLSLRVNRRNYQAVNFYFKHGFFIEALDVKDIGGGFVMDDFLMRKIL